MSDAQTNQSQPPRTLVTGGAGFVGSHLCDRFIAEGHEVVCLDNLLTGRLENIRHLLESPRFTFFEHDVSASIGDDLPIDLWNGLAKALQPGKKLDYVLHFASPASPKDYERYPIETLKAGAMGTHNALEFAKSQGSAFLLASTSEVYGDPQVNPQPETYWGHVNPNGPRSVYDEAKRFAEAITMAYHRQYRLRVHIARIFNTYGERMRIHDGRVLPNFMMQALQQRPLTIYGDGSQTRSLCYVGDLVDGIYRLLLSDETGPINLGNPEEITIRQLAQEVIEITGSKSSLVHEPLPTDDPCRRQPDISNAIDRLGWRPKTRRRHGIERLIPYFEMEIEKFGRAEMSSQAI